MKNLILVVLVIALAAAVVGGWVLYDRQLKLQDALKASLDRITSLERHVERLNTEKDQALVLVSQMNDTLLARNAEIDELRMKLGEVSDQLKTQTVELFDAREALRGCERARKEAAASRAAEPDARPGPERPVPRPAPEAPQAGEPFPSAR